MNSMKMYFNYKSYIIFMMLFDVKNGTLSIENCLIIALFSNVCHVCSFTHQKKKHCLKKKRAVDFKILSHTRCKKKKKKKKCI